MLPFPFLFIANQAESQYGGTVGPDLGRYVFVCVLILGTTVGLAFAFRKLIAETVRKKAARRSMRVLDVLPLSGKGRLNVVRCYDRTFLLGVSDKQVGLIAELDSVIGEDAVSNRVPAEDTPAFTTVLDALTQSAPALPSSTRRTPAANAGQRLNEVVG